MWEYVTQYLLGVQTQRLGSIYGSLWNINTLNNSLMSGMSTLNKSLMSGMSRTVEWKKRLNIKTFEIWMCGCKVVMLHPATLPLG